ncbi:Mitochondrial dicarboxylate transporter [Dissophora globulifera]|uniref:Mitochondrial dicarboxylate transporter n=1 Tax=Dissophora globulifera TaxID=979702 RepID=A0A9P6UTC5_9FUNG|nr:Mitochondrial dicarboxylate transporter [Dissophora globulifera]KAG0318325.1 Mitochondrial dicarboxylate transporter [Dissophora globulifera]
MAQVQIQTLKPSLKTRDPFWLGGAASCAAAFVSHPFDLAKVRLQTTQGANKQGMITTMINVARNEGFFALYTGLSASLLRQGTYSTVRFGTYDLLKDRFAPKDGSRIPVSTMILCGVLAGCVGGGFGNPADVVNIRMVNDGKLPKEQQRHYKHAIDGLYRIIKEEGPAQLMRGLGTNINRAVLMTASQLVSYDGAKRQLLATPWFTDNLATHFASSLLAGLVATTVCAPLDVLKTRIMNSSGGDTSSSKMFVQIVKSEGPSALFKGWLPAFLRLGPHTIVTFIVLEQLKTLVHKNRQ